VAKKTTQENVPLWNVVEPIEINFEVPVGLSPGHIAHYSKHMEMHGKMPMKRSEVEAEIKCLIVEEKTPVRLVAEKLGISRMTVRRICRTLGIRPHRGESGKLNQSDGEKA